MKINAKAKVLISRGDIDGAKKLIQKAHKCGIEYASWIISIYNEFGECDIDKLAKNEDYFDKWFGKLQRKYLGE